MDKNALDYLSALTELRTTSIEIGIMVFATISLEDRADLLERLLSRVSLLSEYDSRAVYTMYAGILEGANHSQKTCKILDKIQSNNSADGIY